MTVTKHLLVDFGEVISRPQPPAAMTGMAALVGLPPETFSERYWAFRAPYDRGSSAQEYWADVVGRPVPRDELAELRRRDLESWTHLNTATIAALRDAYRRGAQLTLLSNAPHDLAEEVGRHADLTEVFTLLLFSAELRLAKPTPEIFDIALSLAERPPEDTLFIDDRDENLRAAESRGIRTHRFTAAETLDATLRDIDFLPPRPPSRNRAG
ncbi:HAD-IA family hydrolase [Leifsonia poae]|uniref:HAD-IA family hydrolase n=1 Tax=Leifsonia poae TaxID=110933 RepID=UPI001CBD88FE|nr:HAD-IA family hydrolase [Leifsonia poae]